MINIVNYPHSKFNLISKAIFAHTQIENLNHPLPNNFETNDTYHI